MDTKDYFSRPLSCSYLITSFHHRRNSGSTLTHTFKMITIIINIMAAFLVLHNEGKKESSLCLKQ